MAVLVVTGALCCFITLAPCPLATPLAAQDAAADPIPIQRILLPPEKLAAEMERVRQKVLTQLPRDEFERLVRRAAAADAAARNPPRLVEARYRASLADEGLIGTADLKVLHTAPEPGRLPLNGLFVALRQARWAKNRPALLGFLDDRPNAPLELLVEQPGEHTLSLEWSARGLPEPNGLRFDLRLPPCPVATLELDLPADQTPHTDRETCVVTGPSPATDAARRLWHISFAGPTPGQPDAVLLLLQRPPQPGQPVPLLRPSLHTTQRLTPGNVECDFDVDLLVQRGTIREIVFDCDPGLRPFEVIAPGLDGWETKAGPNEASQLSVRLREPFAGGRILVRAVAPLGAADAIWVSPALRVAGGLPREETLTLRVHPDLRLDDWKPGGFRWVDALTAADRAHVITLRAGLGDATRPSARVRPVGTVFDVQQTAEWLIEPDRSTVNVQVQYLVQRGVLPTLAFTFASGWEVAQVEATPADPALHWSVPSGTGAAPGRHLLTIEPGRPIAAANGALDDGSRDIRLTVRLRSGPTRWLAGPDGPTASLPFPDLSPVGVRQREGAVTLRVDPALSATSETSLTQVRADLFVYRGPEVAGTLHVRQRRTRLQAGCEVDAALGNGRVRTTARLTLRSAGGAGREFLLFTSAPVRGGWTYKVLQGAAEVESLSSLPELDAPLVLAALGAASPLHVPGNLVPAHARAGRWWRLTLDRPLQDPLRLELACEAPLAGERADVPLLGVAGAEPLDGQATIQLPSWSNWDAESSGLHEELPPAAESAGQPSTMRRRFRYSSTPAYLTLVKRSQRATDQSPRGGAATLLVSPTPDARMLTRFRMSLAGWSERVLPVRLPAGATLMGAHIDGHAVTVLQETDGGVRLPWPSGDSWTTAELVYATSCPRVRVAAQLEAAAPELPFTIPFRCVWRVPDGVTPVVSSDWTRLPGGTSAEAWSDLLVRVRPENWPEAQRRGLAEAARGQQSADRLGDALARLAFEQRPELGALVLDGAALRDAGISPATPLARSEPGQPLWEAAGLTQVPCRGAALLTTRSRALAWRGVAPADVTDAVAEAAASGRDRSGRFQLVVDWLSQKSSPSQSATPFGDSSEGWTDWEAPAGQGGAVLVVRARAVWIAGLVMAFVLTLIAGMAIGGRGRVSGPLLLAWPVLAGLAWLWLPAQLHELAGWPLAAGVICASVAVVVARLRRPAAAAAPSSNSKHLKPAAAVASVALALGLGLTLTSVAAAPGPVPVYLVPGPADNPEPRSVLAPPELVEQLRALSRRGAPTAGAILLGARYEGRSNGTLAQFDAHFSIHSFAAGPNSVTVPLDGVLLREVRLNGSPALPKAGSGPDRYAFDLPGHGPHSLILSFDVPVTGTLDRETRFRVPELPISRLTFQAPAGTGQLQALAWRGAQQLTPDAKGPRVDVDLGRVGVVHLRWREPGAEPPARPQVQELALWDVLESEARLRAAFRFRFGQIHVSSLEFDVPPELEVATASARLLGERLGPIGTVALRDWRRPAPGRVRLEFQAPLTGPAVVTLELIPKQPFDLRPLLPIPSVVGDYERERYVAVRIQGWEASVVESRGLAPSARETFRDLWRPLRLETNARLPDLTFQRLPGQEAALRLALQAPKPPTQGEQRIAWQVGPGRAEVRATAIWNGLPTTGVVEWDVPANVTITELRGRDLRSWTRTGSRVQAWLDRGVEAPLERDITLELTGWLPQPPAAAESEQTPFVLPLMQLAGLKTQTAYVQVKPRDGWRVFASALGSFRPLPDSDLPGFRWSGVAAAPAGRTTFQLHPARGQADLALLTIAEAPAGQFAFTTTIEVVPPAGIAAPIPNSILVELRHSGGAALKWDLPPGVRLRETRIHADGGAWVVDLGPGAHRLTLKGERRSTPSRQDFTLPTVTAHALGSSWGRTQRWLALVGNELRPSETTGMRTIAPAALPPTFDIAQKPALARAGSLWLVEREDAGMRVRVVAQAGAARTSTGVPVEVTAALAEDGAWLLEGRYAIAHDGEADWAFRMGHAGKLLAASVDGQPLPLRPDPAGAVPLLLPANRPHLYTLRVVWQPMPGPETHPAFPLPQLEVGGATTPLGPVFWTVRVPSGRRLRAHAGAPPLSPVAFDLQRAAALSELFRQANFADDERSGSLRVDRLLRNAEYRLALPAEARVAEYGPNGQTLSEWLTALRSAHPPVPLSAEKRDTEAPDRQPYAATFERGRPYHWRTSDATVPPFRLEPDDEPVQRLALTGVLTLLLLFALTWGRRLSPG